MPTLPEHPSSPPVFSGVRVMRSLVLYVCFVDRCLPFCTFSFGHCVVCSSSIYGFWLPLWYLQTLLAKLNYQCFCLVVFIFFCCCMYIFCTYITNEIQEFNINMPIKLDKLCFHLRYLHMVHKPCWPLFPLLVYGFFCNEFFFLKIVKTKHRISRLVIQQIKVTSIFSFLVYDLLTLLNLYFLKLFLYILPDEECYAKFNLQNS
jgi:hypothetical protein